MLDILLDQFHFSSLWNGGIFLFVCFAIIIYLFILPEEKDHQIWKKLSFIVGLVILFLAIASPLNIIARIEFSAHIIQLVLLLFLVPPLLIYGAKTKLLAKLISIPIIAKLVQFLTHPIIAIGLFYFLFYGYHHPPIFDFARMDLYLNYFYLLGLFAAAILLWVSILSKKRPLWQRLGYVIVNTVFIIPLCVMLLFSKESFYAIYTDLSLFINSMELCLPTEQTLPPEYFEMLLPFAPIDEQFYGGIILLISSVVMLGILTLYHISWEKRSNKIQ